MNDLNSTLIVGKGEIGKSLEKVFSPHYDTDIIDKGETSSIKPDIMHIAFPCNEKFFSSVKGYQERYKPKYTVIHSTTPIGMSRSLNAVHSPVIGLHPHLEESLKTFTKYLGGKDASNVADYFRRTGMKTYLVEKSESTEYMKIMSTTFYGVMIELHKQVKTDCKEMDIPFELFTLWNMNYNEGYEKLGYPEYKKPLLVPIMKDVSGHCVLPNTQLLENDFTELIKKRNNK